MCPKSKGFNIFLCHGTQQKGMVIKMKKTKCKKLIGLLISIIMILQTIPVNAFAADLETLKNQTNESVEDDAAKIVAEVVEKRGEYNKVYLLEDGSYYSISTFSPLHQQINGKWENINNNSQLPHSVRDAEKTLQQTSKSCLQNEEIKNNGNTRGTSTVNNSIIYNCLDTATETNGIISFATGSLMLIKPVQINHLINHNKVILEASISVECTVGNGHNINSPFYLKEVSIDWDENSTNALLDDLEPDEMKTLDYNCINANGTFRWNITDLYTKWDKGVTDNNGCVFYSSDECSIQISSVYISIRYKDINETDLDSTYHTIDMGRAGIASVNDLTSSLKIEQTILDVDRAVLPISLKRIYDSTKPLNSSSAGGCFRWNYESNIVFDGNVASWYMIDGTVSNYIPSSPLETIDGYQKWVQIGRSNSQATLWIKATELNSNNYNYQNFYAVDNNEIEYYFNTTGKLIKMQLGDNEFNQILFNYTNDVLTSIVYNDSNGIVTTVSITISNSGSGYVLFTAYDSNNNNASSQLIQFSTGHYNNGKISSNTITFNDGGTVTYSYDEFGCLYLIESINNTTLEISYKNIEDSSEDGGYVTEYEYYDNNVSNNVVIDSSRTFYREFEIDNQIESIKYNNNFNIIEYKDVNNNYLISTYDENDVLVNSYVVNETNSIEKLNNPSFEIYNGFTRRFSYWTSSDHVQRETDISKCDGSSAKFKDEDENFSAYLYQVHNDLVPDTVYVFGSNIRVSDSTPSYGSLIYLSVDVKYTGTNDYVNIVETPFDITFDEHWQKALTAFTIDENVSDVKFSIVYNGKAGTVLVDNATLFEYTGEQADFAHIDTSSPYTITRNNDNTIGQETLTDGVLSLTKSYTYQNGMTASVTDINGITTYYSYDDNTGKLIELGNMMDGNDEIINPVEFTYYSSGLIDSIEQTVRNINTNSRVNLKTSYLYNSSKISRVTHNGFSYYFSYNQDGRLINVSIGSGNDNQTDSITDFSYSNGNISTIDFSNGYRIEYSYLTDSDLIEYIVIKKINNNNSTETIKTFKYFYNEDNTLYAVCDFKTGYTVIFNSTGFCFYKRNFSGVVPSTVNKNNLLQNALMMYSKEKDENETTIETYYPSIYQENGNPKVKVVTTPNSYSKNIQNDNLITSSFVTLNKIIDYTPNNGYEEKSYSYRREKEVDYFGRIAKKIMESKTINESGKRSQVTDTYEYKTQSSNTTTLVSAHSTSVDLIDDLQNEVENQWSSKVYYEYDDKGNIIFEYSKDQNSTVYPIVYYKYDASNQLIGEYNKKTNTSITYTYDAGGNRTSKIFHDISTVVCAGNEVTNFGTVTSTLSYQYDNVWKDQLVGYGGQTINYDDYGNPLTYIAETYSTRDLSGNAGGTSEVSGTMEWSGEYLTAFETENNRYEYEYDAKGFRTKKTVYNISNANGNKTYTFASDFVYVWDNDNLRSIVFQSESDLPLQTNILYDQTGEMSGFISYTGHVFQYVKDINGSVIGLVDETGNKIVDIIYDAWGKMTIKINITASGLDTIKYLAMGILVTLNPITYNSYLFDYETGLYILKEKCYSPEWGRYLNPSNSQKLLEKTQTVLSSNLYLFSENNLVNRFEPFNLSVRNSLNAIELNNGFEIKNNSSFLSRAFCTVYANQIIKKYGVWNYNEGYTYCDMDTLEISERLFAFGVGKYAPEVINKVNVVWGTAWLHDVQNSEYIQIYKNDSNSWKYEKIWFAASSLKQQAWYDGIIID